MLWGPFQIACLLERYDLIKGIKTENESIQSDCMTTLERYDLIKGIKTTVLPQPKDFLTTS